MWGAVDMDPTRIVVRLRGLVALAVVALVNPILALADGPAQAPAPLRLRDKTLVAWVTVAEHAQRGGSVLTLIDPQERFDAIVFGEITPGKWMPGSDFFRRTPHDQGAWPTETAGPSTLVRMALVHEGARGRLYRDGALLTEYDAKPPQEFGDDVAVVIGLRHMFDEGLGNNYFHGTVTEARLYDRALGAATIQQLAPGTSAGPAPYGQWVFRDGKAVETTGRFPYLALHGGAKVEGGRLVLDGVDGCLVSRRVVPPKPYASPIHFRPKVGRLADTIPFFHDGKYHVFYLRAIEKVPWEHIVSTDLVHWTELPTALKSNGPPDGPDGQHMFTGCVVERAGSFHIFYVGWNPRNPAGIEFIRHATSPDLVTWTKHPDFLFGPDGKTYSSARQRDFRDPYVWWNASAHCYWMVICTGGKTGVATSPDLEHWTLQPPLDSDCTGMGTPECPDYFQIGDVHYLIMSPTATSSTYARYAPALRGPYRDPVSPVVDTRILYAAKRMFDGKRHVLVGWIRDLGGNRDGGPEQWGGDMCVPRELSPGPDGQLRSRPVPEAVALFQHKALSLADHPPVSTPGWSYEGPVLEGAESSSLLRFDAPDNYLLQARLELDPQAAFTLAFRVPAAADTGYRLTIARGGNEAEIAGPGFRYARRVKLDTTRPITVTAFVQGSIIECFLDDTYAFSCRAYSWSHGALGLAVKGGKAQVLELTVKTCDDGRP
jgi:beta-fructofuranosidase